MNAPLGTILVVDDEREILDMLTDHLEDEGYAVSQAVDGEQALEGVRREPPDLVLLDITMPGVNGLEVLRRLRRDHPRIPVVMITGIEAEALARSTFKMGGSRGPARNRASGSTGRVIGSARRDDRG